MNSGLLLDTNIISRFSPDRKEKSSEGLRKWLHIRAEAGTLYLSAITISEIERGMRKLPRSGGMKRAKLMNDWRESLTENFGDRVLPVDCVVARIAAAMEDDAKTKGRHPLTKDAFKRVPKWKRAAARILSQVNTPPPLPQRKQRNFLRSPHSQND